MKSVVGVILLGLSLGGLFMLNKAARSKEGKSLLNVAGSLAVPVELEEPTLRTIVRSVQAPGEVEAFSEVDISAEVVGKILELPVEEGDYVKKGDLLCRLDDAVLLARITSAEANIIKLDALITQAEAERDKSERDYRRQLRLVESDATSQSELADYRTARIRGGTQVQVRKQELVEAEARLATARQDLSKTVITAPIDGVVSQLFAENGEVVVTGTMNNAGTRIMVISDLSKMQVRCRVDESDAPLVSTGQVARIFLQSDAHGSTLGHVLRVAIKGTKKEGRDIVTFETLVLVDSHDGRIKPGMTTNVEIEVARKDGVLTLPVHAVVHRKRKDLPTELVKEYDAMPSMISGQQRRSAAEYLKVIFLVSDDEAHPHLVQIGISDESGVEIVSGLSLGDRVVTGPFRSLDQLKDGATVEADKESGDDEKKADSEKSAGASEPVSGGGDAQASAETGS